MAIPFKNSVILDYYNSFRKKQHLSDHQNTTNKNTLHLFAWNEMNLLCLFLQFKYNFYNYLQHKGWSADFMAF